MKDLLAKYNQPGPRYTSYPPATEFYGDFCQNDYAKIITDSNSLTPQNISIYIHIPFCPKQCFYCGCNTAINCQSPTIARYLSALKSEILMIAKLLDKNRQVTQIHWGGGTP
ncbi:MAG: radical SAM protein, partial [Lentisphaeria bacterium]